MSNYNRRDCLIPASISGLDQLHNKRFNKGEAFTREERNLLGIQGLLPYNVKTQDKQIEECMDIFRAQTTDTNRYIFFRIIVQTNEKLYFKMVRDHINEIFPYIYPAIISLMALHYPYLQIISPRCMFITIKDKGHIYDVINNWPETQVKVICCSNSENCNSLGDLGAHGMAIVISKSEAYTIFGGIKPYETIPIILDVGTNSQMLIQNQSYVGVRAERCSTEEFEEFMDEFMWSVKERFGRNCIVNFENFGFDHAVHFLEKYRNKYCMFDNDLQSAGAAILGGLLATIRLTNLQMKDHKILFYGAGKTAIGTAHFITLQMVKEGLEIEEAREHIWLFDSAGLVSKNRTKGQLNESKKIYAHCLDPVDTLIEAIEIIKPTILIGLSKQPGSFTKSVIQKMSEINKLPIVFALSDPPNYAECTAKQAVCWSKGHILYASGSPSNPMEHDKQIFSFSMCSDAYIYPGIILGVTCSGCSHIVDPIYMLAAEKLAKLVTMDELQLGLLFPPVGKLSSVALAIAEAVLHYTYRSCLATNFPKPKDKIEFIKSKQYCFEYVASLPKVYKQ